MGALPISGPGDNEQGARAKKALSVRAGAPAEGRQSSRGESYRRATLLRAPVTAGAQGAAALRRIPLGSITPERSGGALTHRPAFAGARKRRQGSHRFRGVSNGPPLSLPCEQGCFAPSDIGPLMTCSSARGCDRGRLFLIRSTIALAYRREKNGFLRAAFVTFGCPHSRIAKNGDRRVAGRLTTMESPAREPIALPVPGLQLVGALAAGAAAACPSPSI